VWRLASLTGWGYFEIMEEIPFAAGLQIIDAEHYSNGIPRVYRNSTNSFDSEALINEAFNNVFP
jgi:hypothetical protein